MLSKVFDKMAFFVSCRFRLFIGRFICVQPSSVDVLGTVLNKINDIPKFIN